MSESIFKHAVVTASIMLGFTIVGTALMAYTYKTTRDPIAESERQAKLRLL